MRRGDIRTALLSVLGEGPGHGYDIMRRLEEKSGGAWRPSAGSVYPTLQQLEDEGLATSAEADGKRVYTITDAGHTEAERRVAEGGGDLWSHGRGSGVHPGMLFRSIGGLAFAGKQAVAAGLSQAQLAQAIKIVDDARQQLYRLLADGPPLVWPTTSMTSPQSPTTSPATPSDGAIKRPQRAQAIEIRRAEPAVGKSAGVRDHR